MVAVNHTFSVKISIFILLIFLCGETRLRRYRGELLLKKNQKIRLCYLEGRCSQIRLCDLYDKRRRLEYRPIRSGRSWYCNIHSYSCPILTLRYIKCIFFVNFGELMHTNSSYILGKCTICRPILMILNAVYVFLAA